MADARRSESGSEMYQDIRPSYWRILGHVPLSRPDAKRSIENIMRWNSYLPTECVRSMVRMGWDYTT